MVDYAKIQNLLRALQKKVDAKKSKNEQETQNQTANEQTPKFNTGELDSTQDWGGMVSIQKGNENNSNETKTTASSTQQNLKNLLNRIKKGNTIINSANVVVPTISTTPTTPTISVEPSSYIPTFNVNANTTQNLANLLNRLKDNPTIPTSTLPTIPTLPTTPTVPTRPTIPTKPTTPTVPTTPTIPTTPTVPTEPTVPTTPTVPTEPTIAPTPTVEPTPSPTEEPVIVDVTLQEASKNALFEAWKMYSDMSEYATDFVYTNNRLTSFKLYNSNYEVAYNSGGEQIAVMQSDNKIYSVYQLKANTNFVKYLEENYYDRLSDNISVAPENYGVNYNYTIYQYGKLDGKLVSIEEYNTITTQRNANLNALKELMTEHLIDLKNPSRLVDIENPIYNKANKLVSFSLAGEKYNVTYNKSGTLASVASTFENNDGIGQTLTFTTVNGQTYLSDKESVFKITPNAHEPLLEKVHITYSENNVESSREVLYKVNGKWTPDYPYTVELPWIEYPSLTEGGSVTSASTILYNETVNSDGTISKIWTESFNGSNDKKITTKICDNNGNVTKTTVEDQKFDAEGSLWYYFVTEFDANKNYSARNIGTTECLGDGYLTITTAQDPDGLGVNTEYNVEKILLPQITNIDEIDINTDTTLLGSLYELADIRYPIDIFDENLEPALDIDTNTNTIFFSGHSNGRGPITELNEMLDIIKRLMFDPDISLFYEVEKNEKTGLIEGLTSKFDGTVFTFEYDEDNKISKIERVLHGIDEETETMNISRDNNGKINEIVLDLTIERDGYKNTLNTKMKIDSDKTVTQTDTNITYTVYGNDYYSDETYTAEYTLDEDLNFTKFILNKSGNDESYAYSLNNNILEVVYKSDSMETKTQYQISGNYFKEQGTSSTKILSKTETQTDGTVKEWVLKQDGTMYFKETSVDDDNTQTVIIENLEPDEDYIGYDPDNYYDIAFEGGEVNLDNAEGYKYDSYGNLTYYKDKDVTYSARYDENGIIRYRTKTQNGKTCTWSYDENGKCISMSDGTLSVYHEDYSTWNKNDPSYTHTTTSMATLDSWELTSYEDSNPPYTLSEGAETKEKQINDMCYSFGISNYWNAGSLNKTAVTVSEEKIGALGTYRATYTYTYLIPSSVKMPDMLDENPPTPHCNTSATPKEETVEKPELKEEKKKEILPEELGKKPISTMTEQEMKQEIEAYWAWQEKNGYLTSDQVNANKTRMNASNKDSFKSLLRFVRKQMAAFDGSNNSYSDDVIDNFTGTFLQSQSANGTEGWGDCWFLSAINCLSQSEINSLITDNGDSYTVNFPGDFYCSNDKTTYKGPFNVNVTKAEAASTRFTDSYGVTKNLSTGDEDVQVLEIALLKLFGFQKTTGNVDRAGLNLLKGTSLIDPYELWMIDFDDITSLPTPFGINNYNDKTSKYMAAAAQKIDFVNGNDNATKALKNIKFSSDNKSVQIGDIILPLSHEYKLDKINGKFVLINPHMSSETIEIDEIYLQLLCGNIVLDQETFDTSKAKYEQKLKLRKEMIAIEQERRRNDYILNFYDLLLKPYDIISAKF